ncbi:hypothetical protein DL766_008915 [Monosporascus sp. MC13-8B]|uniref:Uncharacterized protein n=1 Tax=Monosporascus cannonballus TaxID=155416 RepID=A0ABY0HIT2_9PEZI|nr:hypothetical protein DL762_000538 [Monosporascus cannonballus]RYP17342.1 hypothetical protein DL766_008915 [Monosporascus sp. MC13-8B]
MPPGDFTNPNNPSLSHIRHSVVMDGPDPPVPVLEDKSLLAKTRRIFRKLSTLFRRKHEELDGNKRGPEQSNRDVKPLLGVDAYFTPDADPQLTFTAFPTARLVNSPTWLAKRIPRYAAKHPHHLAALNNKRSLMVRISLQALHADDGQIRTTCFYNFGPGSKYNVVMDDGPFSNKDEAIAYVHVGILDYIYDEVLPARREVIGQRHTASDGPLLQEDPESCRLVISTEFLPRRPIGDTSTGPAKALTNTVKYLTRLGFEVKLFSIRYIRA